MKYYAGLDVSMKETFVCILDEGGKRVYECSVYTDPKVIFKALQKSGFSLEKVGIESGSLSAYLIKALKDLGCNALCIDSRKMAAILSVTVNKTDKNDARGIADAMRCNHYKEVNVRQDHESATDILLLSRETHVHERMRLKNKVRGFLKAYGIRLGTVSHSQFSNVVRSYYPKVLSNAQKGIESLLTLYEVLCQEIIILDKTLKEIVEKDKEVKRLMTVPGVGKIVALSFKTDIGDAGRFHKSSSVGAYYGMAPRQYSSGEIVRQSYVSKCGSRRIRTLLSEAAIALLTRVKAWSSLKVWGLKIMRKHGLKKASMAVGRKLAVILHRMLVTGDDFKYGPAKASTK